MRATRVLACTILLWTLFVPGLGWSPARAASGPVYAWHTFYGSSTWDYGYAMTVDGNGNLYITGESGGSWNGPSGQMPLHAYTSGDDIFVLKLDSNGAYQWHTFYGGDDESGEGIAVDNSGNVYICGNSSVAWNGPAGQAPLHPYSGGADMLVLKLNTNGAYQWHAYYGNPTSDDCFDIAVKNGSLAITGFSSLGWDGPNSTPPIHALTGYGDMTLVKLNTNGDYEWHTFYGGSSSLTSGYGVDIDGAGNITVAGESAADWQLPSPPLHAYTGGKDIFAVQVDNAGAYRWHTFYGSAADDSADDIVVDSINNLALIGSSDSAWNAPTVPVTAFAGGSSDMAIIKLNADGLYQWHSFHGSDTFDSGRGIDVDANGILYVSGYKDVNVSYFGNAEIWVSRLAPQGALLDTVTYPSSAFDIAVDSTGNIYVAGDSSHTWDQNDETAPLHPHSGSDEIVVVKTLSSPTSIFADVPPSHWAWNYIERLYNAGVTGGCGANPLVYCPNAPVTRAQMAVFLLVAKHGTGYTPPAASGLFADVPAGNPYAAWIEQLAAEGITGGCGGGNYCPNSPVIREQMAVFLLAAEHGTGYTPPTASGIFTDVPAGNPYAPWIEQLAAEGITGGCGGGNYCPAQSANRGQMAVFLVKAFNLP